MCAIPSGCPETYRRVSVVLAPRAFLNTHWRSPFTPSPTSAPHRRRYAPQISSSLLQPSAGYRRWVEFKEASDSQDWTLETCDSRSDYIGVRLCYVSLRPEIRSSSRSVVVPGLTCLYLQFPPPGRFSTRTTALPSRFPPPLCAAVCNPPSTFEASRSSRSPDILGGLDLRRSRIFELGRTSGLTWKATGLRCSHMT